MAAKKSAPKKAPARQADPGQSGKAGKSGKSGAGKSGGHGSAHRKSSTPPSPRNVRVDVIEQAAGRQDSTTKALMLPPGAINLAAISSTGTPVGPQNKKDAAALMAEIGAELSALQEKLVAEAIRGGKRRVLLVLQGMDTSGKDGVVKHVVGLVNPAGVRLTAFKKPTAEERQHDFLWRIASQVPLAGHIGVFNRSHYEDVLIVRVHDLVPREEWSTRYAKINAFERRLVREGTVVIKCFLHISKDTQRERLADRLDDPTKYWKYNPADLVERGFWNDYQAAYAEALRRCNTLGAPWFVIPSDRKWYRNWAIASILLETMRQLDPQYPPADFDVEMEKKLLAES